MDDKEFIHEPALPVVQKLIDVPNLSKPYVVQSDDTPETVRKEDLKLANQNLQILHSAWNLARDLHDVLALSRATFQAIRERRDVLTSSYDHHASAKRDFSYDTPD